MAGKNAIKSGFNRECSATKTIFSVVYCEDKEAYDARLEVSWALDWLVDFRLNKSPLLLARSTFGFIKHFIIQFLLLFQFV